MNTLFRSCLLFVSIFVTLVAAEESTVTVAGSRELRLALVDSAKATAARDAAHSAFAVGLGKAVSNQGSEVGVKVKCVSADQAASNLSRNDSVEKEPPIGN